MNSSDTVPWNETVAKGCPPTTTTTTTTTDKESTVYQDEAELYSHSEATMIRLKHFHFLAFYSLFYRFCYTGIY